MTAEWTNPPVKVEGLHVDVETDVPEEARELVKQSVAVMAEHSIAREEARHRREAPVHVLRRAIAAPLIKVIQADSEAVTAIDRATADVRNATEQFPITRPPFPTARPLDLAQDALLGARGLRVFGPPYDFLVALACRRPCAAARSAGPAERLRAHRSEYRLHG